MKWYKQIDFLTGNRFLDMILFQEIDFRKRVNKFMAITIQDIAQRLHLAPSTVSKALNDYPHISPKTRERVANAARELGYVPSAAARDLRRCKTDRIGFLYGFASVDIGEYASRLIHGAVSAAEQSGYNVLLYPLTGNRLEKLSRICKTREVDGLLLMGGEHLAEAIDLLQKEQIPFVVLNRQLEQPNISFVAADYHRGTIEAINHLIELGHERIAFIGQSVLEKLHSDRIASYEQALNEANLAIDPHLVISAGTEQGDGYKAMQTLLARARPPTAVLAVHDPLAIECLQAVHDAGCRVPDDVAIIGSDNLRESQSTIPSLTTIHPPLAEIGRQAMKGLLRQLSDTNDSLTRLIVPVKFVIRQSTCGNRF
ncbi:LacI family transcriptional regulator [Chloroflexi bacterium TSY]|nr:LacI family transcriptional regulator [Chloroflexi bacterium TSY]